MTDPVPEQPKPPERPCEKCPNPRVRGERFCRQCRAALLRQMREDGYLTPYPSNYERPKDAREDTEETKFGPDE